MKDIQKIHDEVFTYLQNWSEEARQTGLINPYFYMRSIRDERFKKGYWFPGDETYLCVSFWVGSDGFSKTPNIFFAISENGCHATITSRDSESKSEYFKNLVTEINVNVEPSYIQEDKSGFVWYKKYSNSYLDYKIFLKEFINTDKRLIDNYLFDNPIKLIEEFVSDFSFIDQNRYEKMLSRVFKEKENIKSNQLAKKLSGKELPFVLTKIEIENYQNIIKASISDLPPDAQWIFITGDNGYGKTCLLRAIALGFNDNPDLEKYFEDSKTRITLEYQFKSETDFIIRSKGSWENTNVGLNRKYINNKIEIEKYILGYGPARLNVQKNSLENNLIKTNNVESLFDNMVLLKNINDELLYSHLTDVIFYEQLKNLIKVATNNKIIDIIIDKRDVRFIEIIDNDSKSDPLPLEKIAAGYRSIINLVFDIYFRFNEIGWWSEPSKYFGIVLIDELENHLHPILQKKLPKLLSDIFPNIQFIVTTHSPVPLLGAPKNSAILKVNRSFEEGITIEQINIDNIETLNPNILFTSSIFGFTSIFSDSLIDKRKLRTENGWEEMKETEELDKKLIDMYNKRKNK